MSNVSLREVDSDQFELTLHSHTTTLTRHEVALVARLSTGAVDPWDLLDEDDWPLDPEQRRQQLAQMKTEKAQKWVALWGGIAEHRGPLSPMELEVVGAELSRLMGEPTDDEKLAGTPWAAPEQAA